MAVLVFATATAVAQGIPSCATSCIDDATTKVSNCKVGDYTCSCVIENLAAIQREATSCVVKSCGVEIATGKSMSSSPRLKKRSWASSAPSFEHK